MPRSSVIAAIAGGKAFNPKSISGLQLWLDASDTSTITESGGDVSQWDDKSGNDNHAVQATATKQPVTGTRSINGLNVIDFADGSGGDIMSGNISLASSGFTLFQVFQSDADTSYSLLELPDESVAYSFSAEDGSALTTTGFAGTLYVNGLGTAFTNRDDLYVAFGANPVIAVGTAANVSSTTYQTSNTNDSFKLDGVIAEILVYDSVLSTTDREAVDRYLAAKWNVALV